MESGPAVDDLSLWVVGRVWEGSAVLGSVLGMSNQI